MDLFFSVNGGEEKKLNLRTAAQSARTLTGTYFFLKIQAEAGRFTLLRQGARTRTRNNQRHLLH
jgi:hypothetical protein